MFQGIAHPRAIPFFRSPTLTPSIHRLNTRAQNQCPNLIPNLLTSPRPQSRLINQGSSTVLTLKFIYIASGLCAVGLFAYLGYALIRAEKF